MSESIKLKPLNQREALRYMGYGTAKPDTQVQQMLDACETELLQKAIPRYVYRCFDLAGQPEGIAVLGTNLILSGQDIAGHLSGCEKAVLLCATISAEADRLIRILQVQNMSKCVVMDALASVAVEQVCTQAEQLIRQEFEAYYQTWRFGIGYGDLPLELQPAFLEVIDAPKRVGVYATSSLLLTPTKSVTCIIGLSKDPITNQRKGCQTCNMQERCRYRAGGGHCS